jgi:hypothetical protein
MSANGQLFKTPEPASGAWNDGMICVPTRPQIAAGDGGLWCYQTSHFIGANDLDGDGGMDYGTMADDCPSPNPKWRERQQEKGGAILGRLTRYTA